MYRRWNAKGGPFSALLLFQFRAEKRGKSDRNRLCELKILTFRAENSEDAYQAALIMGKKQEFHFDNGAGGITYYEFVGIKELLYLGYSDTREEVWFDMQKILLPMERAKKILPAKKKLNAIQMARHVHRPTPIKPRNAERGKKPLPRRIAVLASEN